VFKRKISYKSIGIQRKIPYNPPVKGSYTEKFGITSEIEVLKEVFRIIRKEVVIMLDIPGFRKRLYGKIPYNK
jgi:hypothetical protein